MTDLPLQPCTSLFARLSPQTDIAFSHVHWSAGRRFEQEHTEWYLPVDVVAREVWRVGKVVLVLFFEIWRLRRTYFGMCARGMCITFQRGVYGCLLMALQTCALFMYVRRWAHTK